MNRFTLFPIVITSMLASQAYAASASDARSVGMGGTGVASANYLTASFHNPALAARYGERDNFGMILPLVGAKVHDGNNMLEKVEDFQDALDDFEDNPLDEAYKLRFQDALKNLQGTEMTANIFTGMVFAVPNKYVSTNLFLHGQGNILAQTNIDDSDLDYDPTEDDINSDATAIAGGTLDLGLTFAKQFEYQDHQFKLGFSPKIQKIFAVRYQATIDEFDDEDEDDFEFSDEYTDKSVFNVDLGVIYDVNDRVHVGFSARNLIQHKLKTNEHYGKTATYLVNPEYAMAVAYNSRLYSLALDVDLNKMEYFEESNYSTQFVKLGGELNAWDWAQLRAGYQYSMTKYADDMVSVGVGLKPFGVFGIDISGQAGKDNQYAVATQLIFQF